MAFRQHWTPRCSASTLLYLMFLLSCPCEAFISSKTSACLSPFSLQPASSVVSTTSLQSPPPASSGNYYCNYPSSVNHRLPLHMLPSVHSDPSWCLTSLLLLSVFGISLEKRTMIGKALSAPLATMALAILASNVGCIPFESPIYSMTTRYLVPLAVPMLLYDSDLRRIVRETGTLLLAFGVGALATLVATVLAFWVLPMASLQQNAFKVACALCARHIGGAINFVAVAETLDIAPSAVSAAIAADNVVIALYFALIFALAGTSAAEHRKNNDSLNVKAVSANDDDSSRLDKATSDDNSQQEAPITLSTLSLAIATSSTLVTLGGILSRALFPGTSSLPTTSLLTVVAATLRPSFFRRIRPAGTAVGIVMIQMFFAASGASGSIALVLRQAPALFWFSALQIGLHLGILLLVGRLLLRLPLRELYLASNACVGGPTTAAAMAQAKQWTSLILPGLLVGILGYATATAMSLALSPVLLRMSTVLR